MSLESPDNTLNVRNAVLKVSRVEMNTLSANTVTSNLEVGTANLFVDTTTGRVGVGTNAPMGTLDVKGVLNHTQVANVAQITSNSNVVMEYKLSTRNYETKEPRIALTANSDRGYVASASDTHDTVLTNNGGPWQAFDGTITQVTTEGWGSPNSRYSNDAAGSTAVNGVANSFNGRDGEWLNIKLPYKITLSSFETFVRIDRDYEHPTSGYLYASNDGFATFQEIYSFTDVAVPGEVNGKVTHTIPSSHLSVNLVAYNEYRLQATKLEGASGLVTIAEWKLYGTPFTANVATGTDVVLHTTPNVPKTDFSNVYYDGQDYTSMPATVADKSGNGVTGTPSGGVGFDTTYKAFTFDGVDDQITATLTNPAGAWVHSASMWFKVNSLSAVNTLFTIKNNTTAENNKTPNFIVFTDGSLRYTFWDNDIYYGGPGTIVPNKWYHVSVTYSGGSDTSSRKMFLNGVELGISSTSGSSQNTALNVYANSTLKIGVYADGTTNPFNGSIANFRLYNQALSADEIWELYAYQKEYFGVSPDVVTLKAGRVGIGTSEPRAVLDVRGGISAIDGVSNFKVPMLFATASTTISIPGYTFTKITFNDTKIDTSGGWNGVDKFTAPISGYYMVTLNHLNYSGYDYLNYTLAINGDTSGANTTIAGDPSTGHYLNGQLMDVKYLNVGDEAEIFFRKGGAALPLASTRTLSIHLISAK